MLQIIVCVFTVVLLGCTVAWYTFVTPNKYYLHYLLMECSDSGVCVCVYLSVSVSVSVCVVRSAAVRLFPRSFHSDSDVHRGVR